MPRPLRLDFPGIPQHVIVRGVNRQSCFLAEGDFRSYLEDLSHSSRRERCAIHAYVLMTTHVHLLVTGESKGSLSRLMQCVGRRYVRRFNASWCRTGTLFEGRFRASLIDSERYLLVCMRYIELNPVRAAMVRSPFDYRWSSIHANAGMRLDGLVTPHAEYRRLGRDDEQRAAAYRFILGQKPPADEIDIIRLHVNRDCALGTPAFQDAMARACGRKTHIGRASKAPSEGRPPSGSMDDLW